MRLKQYISELSMKADTKIEISKRKNKYFDALITLEDGIQWYYEAKLIDENEWDISFYPPEFNKKRPLNKDRGKVALQTFAAVESITKQFIEYQKPDRIEFSASGGSRQKLYDLLATKIAQSGKYVDASKMGISSAKYYVFIKKENVVK
jgi:hypothetical protein